MDVDFSRATKPDFILLAIIFCGLGWMFFNQFKDSACGSLVSGQVNVYCHNQLIQKIDLAQDKIVPLLDQRMMLEVKDGKIRIVKSDCPHQICRHSGWIGKGSETLVCVPNQVILEIKTSDSPVVDIVAS